MEKPIPILFVMVSSRANVLPKTVSVLFYLEPVVLQALQDVFHTKEITYMKREPTRKQRNRNSRTFMEQLKQLEQKEKQNQGSLSKRH